MTPDQLPENPGETHHSDLKSLIKVYLRAYDNLEHEVELRLGAVSRALGQGELVLNGTAFEVCLRHFQRECSKYWLALGVAEPSHLKVFGHLLFSLTQLRDDTSGDRIAFCGIENPNGPKTKDLFAEADFLRVHFHEFASFTVVYEMLISAQRRRKESLRFDPVRPPTNKRFTRSMVDYLRQWDVGPLIGDRTPFDFYMVFKAMDLYGVDAAY